MHESSRGPVPPVADDNRRLLAGCAVLVALLAMACGGEERVLESTVRYEPPLEHRIVVETVVDLPFDRAWDELIRRLSENSIHVSTLEKASRFVQVEMARSSDLATRANRPEQFVDCGRTVRTFSQAGETERFEYAVAESSVHRESDLDGEGFRVSDVERRVALEARTTLYLQPEGDRRTRITVKTRYEVQIEVSGQATGVSRDPEVPDAASVSFGPRIESIRFTTFQPGQDQRRGGVICRATGVLEHSLIALANPAAAV